MPVYPGALGISQCSYPVHTPYPSPEPDGEGRVWADSCQFGKNAPAPDENGPNPNL